MTTITHREIREHLGHNGVECRVRITRDGRVLRHGSPEPTDRSEDYWQDMGTVTEISRELSDRRRVEES